MYSQFFHRLKSILPTFIIYLLLVINLLTSNTIIKQNKLLITKIQNQSNIQNEKFVQSSDDQLLNTIQNELVEIRSEQRKLNQVLGTTKSMDNLSDFLIDSTETSTQSVFIKDSKFQSLDIYEKPIASSKIIGQISHGHKYPLISTDAGWYLIKLLQNLNGYVRTDLVSISNN